MGVRLQHPSPRLLVFTLFQDQPPHTPPKHLPLTLSSTQPALLISNYSAGTPAPTHVPVGPERSPLKAA